MNFFRSPIIYYGTIKILENGLIEEYEEQGSLSCLVTQIELYEAYNKLRLVHPRRQYIEIIQGLLVVLGPFLHTM